MVVWKISLTKHYFELNPGFPLMDSLKCGSRYVGSWYLYIDRLQFCVNKAVLKTDSMVNRKKLNLFYTRHKCNLF